MSSLVSAIRERRSTPALEPTPKPTRSRLRPTVRRPSKKISLLATGVMVISAVTVFILQRLAAAKEEAFNRQGFGQARGPMHQVNLPRRSPVPPAAAQGTLSVAKTTGDGIDDENDEDDESEKTQVV